jgi:hypothetical protein
MKPEHKKLAIAIVLLVAAVGVYWVFGRSSEPLAGSIQCVCVATGKPFSLTRDELPQVFPAKNPKTNQMTLFPTESRDGKLYVIHRHAWSLLNDPEVAKVNKYVDPQTLEVLKSPRQ